MSKDQYKILIVDDNSKNIQLAASILKCDEYKIWYAKDGNDALEKVRDIEFDIILMDVMMPGIDGFETTKLIKQLPNYEQVPIIFLTAKNSSEDLVNGFFNGGVDYIVKPYNSAELAVRVQTHLKLSSQTKELILLNKKLEYLANKDFLTGINNRGRFFNLVEQLYANSSLNDIYICMLDIDKFKNLNDRYGHNVGDMALKEFTKMIESYLLEDDIFGRLGGEEFALVIVSNNQDEVLDKLEKIRASVEEISIVYDDEIIKFTVSVGIVKKLEGESIDSSLDRADKELYKAKKSGRNKLKFRL